MKPSRFRRADPSTRSVFTHTHTRRRPRVGAFEMSRPDSSRLIDLREPERFHTPPVVGCSADRTPRAVRFCTRDVAARGAASPVGLLRSLGLDPKTRRDGFLQAHQPNGRRRRRRRQRPPRPTWSTVLVRRRHYPQWRVTRDAQVQNAPTPNATTKHDREFRQTTARARGGGL
jgi:hypothetical protein